MLGPLEAVVGGRPVPIGAAKPRALLALLLIERNRAVPTERLVEALWGDEPPARATKTLQVYVSQLRKVLGADRLVTRPPGYELRVADGELDLDRFQALAAEARAHIGAGDAPAAAARLEEALALWRGPALREFRAEPFAEAAARRLEELRLGRSRTACRRSSTRAPRPPALFPSSRSSSPPSRSGSARGSCSCSRCTARDARPTPSSSTGARGSCSWGSSASSPALPSGSSSAPCCARTLP